MVPLTTKELQVLGELRRIAGETQCVTGGTLRDFRFAEFVAGVYEANVSYPQSLQSRKLQVLRDKGYIKMERRGGGTYLILDHPTVSVSLVA